MVENDVVIVDASRPGTALDGLVSDTERALAGRCERIRLGDRDIRFCTGCWSCWWKTPGLCVFRDAMDEVLPAMLRSRVVVLATPVFCGLPRAVMKRALDRTIPLVHPYIELHYGESHHRKRYAHYPDIGLMCATGGDEDELRMITTWIERYARNFHARVVAVADEKAEWQEVARELARA